MPRIFDSGNDPFDFCKSCYPKTETQAENLYGNERISGLGPDGRGNCFSYDTEHPDYQDEGYKCIICASVLTRNDN